MRERVGKKQLRLPALDATSCIERRSDRTWELGKTLLVIIFFFVYLALFQTPKRCSVVHQVGPASTTNATKITSSVQAH